MTALSPAYGLMALAAPPPKLMTAIAKDWFGTTYEFQIHPIGANYHARSGVYIFLRQGWGGTWDALYVGETGSFERRLTAELHLHHKWSGVVAAGATHIGTLHVPGELSRRETIETYLRWALNPPLNDQ